MRIVKTVSTALGLIAFSAIAATADGHSKQEPRIYAYSGVANYCPAGLQPVTMNGEICCGKPNQHVSYQHALAHPVAKKKKHVHRVSSAKVDCPVGTKGCTFD